MRALLAGLLVFLFVLQAEAESITSTPAGSGQSQFTGPVYAPGRTFAMYPSSTNIATAIGTVDTVIYLVPFIVRAPMSVSSFCFRTNTGAGSSAVKMGIWAADPATSAPTGTPVISSNTGQATTGSGTNACLTSLSAVLAPGLYWSGGAFTTAGPTMWSITSAQTYIDWLYGRSTTLSSTSTGGYTAPFTYANDITALNLTGATLTGLAGSGGAPVPFITTAP